MMTYDRCHMIYVNVIHLTKLQERNYNKKEDDRRVKFNPFLQGDENEEDAKPDDEEMLGDEGDANEEDANEMETESLEVDHS